MKDKILAKLKILKKIKKPKIPHLTFITKTKEFLKTNVLWVRIALIALLTIVTVAAYWGDWGNLIVIEEPWSTNYQSPGIYDGISKKNVMEQRFQSDYRKIQSISVILGTYGNTLKKGSLCYALLGEDGSVLSEGRVSVEELDDNAFHDFPINAVVSGNEYCTFKLWTEGCEKGKVPAVYVGSVRNEGSELTIGGEKTEWEILDQVTIVNFDWMRLLWAVLLLAAFGVLLFLPYRVTGQMARVFRIAMLFIAPRISFYLVESLYQDPLGKSHAVVLFNYLLYLAVYALCLCIVGEFRNAIVMGNIMTFLIGVINYFIIQFRGVPLCPWDIFSVGTAAAVAGGYSLTVDSMLMLKILILLVLHMCYMHIERDKEPKKPLWMKIVPRIAGIVYPIAIVGWLLGAGSSVLENNGIKLDLFQQQTGYLNNGFYLSFVMNTKYMKVDKPENYAIDEVEQILDKYEEEEQESYADVKPNIIMIMNESYSELAVVGNFSTNQLYAAFYDSLSENTVKGSLFVSVFGGNTCNTEYEVLTGNTMAYLAPGSIAYQQYLNQSSQTGSLVMTLKQQGYNCYAIHPLAGSNWNRNVVYQTMEFDQFYDISAFPRNAELIRNRLVSDLETYKKVVELYESKKRGEQVFIFDVTVQNHGGYLLDTVFDDPVTLQGMAGSYPKVEEYLSLLKISDNALVYLIDYFSQVEEPTMIVLFGDHQPAVEEEFYEELYGKSLSNLSLEEMQRRYEVPFMIWTNYDIEEKTVDALSANYLSTVLLSYTNLKVPRYFLFQRSLMEKVPVINANGYRDADGNYYSFQDKSKYTSLLEQYRILHYNSSIDRKNTQTSMYLDDEE